MDREATKTRGEREDEEVERLVRPSPKVKPPRHDRRRERVEVDEDPDLDAKDKDLSKNFKDIGGSVAGRVLKRWAAAVAAPPKPKPAAPKPPAPAGAGAKPPPVPGAAKPKPKPKPKKIKVRIKDTGKVVWIGEQTLKEDPGGYEVVDDAAEETKAPPQAPAKPSPQPEPKKAPPAEPAAARSVEQDMAARNALLNLAKDDPAFADFLKTFRNPGSANSQFVKGNPGYSAQPFMQGKQLPEGIKTIGDLARVVTLQGKAPKPKKAPKQEESELEQPEESAPLSERDQLKERLKGVKEELKEDPKSEGAKKDKDAIQEALRAHDDYDRLSKELEEAKAALAELEKKGPPSDEEVRSRAEEILKQQQQKKPKSKGKPAEAPAEGAPAEAPAPPAQATPEMEPFPLAGDEDAPPAKQPPAQPVPQQPGTPPAPAQPAAGPPAQGAPQQPPAAQPGLRSNADFEAQLDEALENAALDQRHSGTNPATKLLDYLQGYNEPPRPEAVAAAIEYVNQAAASPHYKDKAKELKGLAKTLKSYGAELKKSQQEAAKKKKEGDKAKKDAEKPKPKSKGPEEPPEPTFAQFQPDRKVSQSEREASDRLIMRSFPPAIAGKLLYAKPRYHPDEVQALVSDYNLAKAMPVPRDISSLVDKASSFYSTDPNQVRPPKKVKTADGKVVDFKSLTDPIEQAKAYRRHQVQTVAMSLAAQSAVAGSLEKNGAPKDLASAMSSFMLSGPGETPTDRDKRASDAAEKLFYGGLQPRPDEPPLSDKAVSQLLKASSDPAVQKLVVGYCQAKDYREARRLFLDPKSSEHISERQSPKEIASRIRKATDWLRKKAERYPNGTTSQDTHTTFRDRVMKHLGNLSPAKQGEVQKLLDVDDNRNYDREMKKYEKAAKVYDQHVQQATKEFDSDYAKYSRALREFGDLGMDPPLGVQDRLLKNKILAPKRPQKPPHYDVLTQEPDELEDNSSSLWDDFTSRNASERRAAVKVASRYAFSFYSATCPMDRSAVYWGVAPYPKGHEGFEPYKDWEQPQARDLGESDYSRVLKAARKWLSTPVLSTKIEGIVRDTQLRAALDLALRAENYDHALHPTLYNKLLARLAGVSEDGTLLTVRSKAARNTMSNKKVELETAQADRFLARLDRMASVVMANQKKWEKGMSFEDARRLVNAIDQLADDVEIATYGADSLLNRQASEIGRGKLAEVLQRDSDERYMDTFKNPMKPRQTEADEPYMKAYGDDQSSGVHHGKSTTGRPLAK